VARCVAAPREPRPRLASPVATSHVGLWRHKYLMIVIPGYSRNANEPGIHNHRRELRREIVVARIVFHTEIGSYGFRARASRAPE